MTNPISSPVAARPDQTQLLKGCRHGIAQCDLLLKLVSAEHFSSTIGNSSVGAHVRHVLDRFQCFFNGLPAGHIDYDARKRDIAVETNLEAAAFALASVSRRLEALAQTEARTSTLTVQESVFHQGPSVAIASTLERELMGLISHTTHHLAIIALLIRPLGYAVDSDFGKAASTIVFESSQHHA